MTILKTWKKPLGALSFQWRITVLQPSCYTKQPSCCTKMGHRCGRQAGLPTLSHIVAQQVEQSSKSFCPNQDTLRSELKAGITLNLLMVNPNGMVQKKCPPNSRTHAGTSRLSRLERALPPVDTCYFIVYTDGVWSYVDAPSGLKDKLEARKRASDLSCVSLGPDGEWFLYGKNGRAWWDGTADMLGRRKQRSAWVTLNSWTLVLTSSGTRDSTVAEFMVSSRCSRYLRHQVHVIQQ
jgi:hypothetical protein